jgi:DNA-directed RNA polymerase subunit alpha
MNYTPLILCLDSRIENSTSLYGRFQIGPIKEGHGLTVANALRRILLSEIKTTGVIAAKIKFNNGYIIPHEYSSLPGVRESTLDLLLNLRNIIFQTTKFNSAPEVAFLNVTGPKIIRASDLNLPETIELIDPDQYIGTINDAANLSIQLLIGYGKNGKSYVQCNSNEPGLFTLSPTFSTVENCNYKVELLPLNSDAQVNSLQEEQIIFEITTNGSIHPFEALQIGIQELISLFTSLTINPVYFSNNNSRVNTIVPKINSKLLGDNILINTAIKKRLCSLDLGNLNLSLKTFRELKYRHFQTIGDLVLQGLTNLELSLSESSYFEIQTALFELGFDKKTL